MKNRSNFPENHGRKHVLLVGLAVMSIAAPILFLLGCQTAPVTERKQLLIMSESEENQMGLTAYEQVLKEEPVTKNAEAVAMVQRVGQRIAAIANRPDFEWEFNVIESETQNAFCLPGGKVAVYTGILPVCQNEAGLAVVMSHEIGHAIARHGGERMTHQAIQNKAKEGLAYLMRNKEETTQQIVLTAYGVGSEYGAILPYSRKHELEADHIGIMLMAKAGYDPSEAPVFWERFSSQKGSAGPVEFLSTHPSDAHRAGALRELLPEAMSLYQAAPEQLGIGAAVGPATTAAAGN
ncbi:MAG: M48 family metallopeptidase [Planctomycetaceae bacterium]|nr:M48 family metallopeptidase [Planctomycetaceae bacterium]